ncbi:MAG: sugar ABC transporter ATP-binding protein [Spirochaetia bacterium]|nr:sugar ABC transporter ATP-binding protein [Spirochaetia bacterium]
MTNNKILEMKNVSKTFPGVKALDNVNFAIKEGTVHAIVGENGAGKSTLMKIIIGLYTVYNGVLIFEGKKQHFKNTNDALINGISMIHQELSSALELTVTQNIFLGKEIIFSKSKLLNKKEMKNKARRILHKIGIMDIDPDIKMKNLSVAKQQLCEIAKAVSYESKIILMDEPTSALAGSDVDKLFETIHRLKESGTTILYVTHKMDEIFKIADNISVFRNGKHIDTVKKEDTDSNQLVKMMVGRSINNFFPKVHVDIGLKLLEVKNLSREGEFKSINFFVRSGEILGVAGLVGAGRSEIMETLFGIRKKTNGEILIKGKSVQINSPRDAINNGFALLTEDRKSKGCFLELSVMINILIASIKKYTGGMLVNKKEGLKKSNTMVEALSIKTSSLENRIKNLSGGNQQKVLVGRWLLTNPEILIVDEPTRGIDVGAKVEIHRMIVDLAKQGKAIIMISSELPEVISMSDRIMVVKEGQITGILNAKKTSQEEIMQYCTKIKI